MFDTTTGLLLFGGFFVLLVLVAIFVLALVYLGKGQAKAQPSRGAASKDAPPAFPPPVSARPRQQAAELAAAQAAAAPAAHPGEVMRVIRDQETGELLVEVDGRRYTHIRQIRDAAVGRRVLSAVVDLVQFTGGIAANPQAVRAAVEEEEAGRVASGTIAVPSMSTPQAPQTGSSPQRLSDLTSLDAIEPALPQQNYSVLGFFRRGFQAPPSEPVPSSTAWIEEIDEILQRTVRALPTPPSQAVRVVSGDDGMLQIIVGVRAYDSADQVPDLQIRGLIEAAVAEWEKS